MEIDLSRFRAAFYEEAGEHLENMEASLLQLESPGDHRETLNTIFRAAHSIKGASSTFGIDQVARFTHVLENLLDRMREGEILPTADLCQLLLQSTDILSGLIHAEKTQSAPPDDVDAVLGRLSEYAHSSGQVTPQSAPASTPAPSLGRSYQIRFRPSATFFHFGQNPLFLIDELQKLGTESVTRADLTALPSLSEMDPEISYVAWDLTLQTSGPEHALQDVFMFVDGESTPTIRGCESVSAPDPFEVTPEGFASLAATESAVRDVPAKTLGSDSSVRGPETTSEAKPGASGPTVSEERRSGADRRQDSGSGNPGSTTSETVRVDRERLDKMINQIGELVIGTSMVEQDWMRFHPDMESTALVQLGKIVRDLQEMSLSLRMVPIAATFQKMARIVRDLSHRLGKQVHLETEGEETELDKTVVDQIGDPLLHMVRNSVDHGIETPEERVAAGKSAEGTICLKAYHQGGNFIIEIQDDGKGLDRNRIL
ncbi:MAG: chemotaxis protein CheA [Planctomyces sp.]